MDCFFHPGATNWLQGEGKKLSQVAPDEICFVPSVATSSSPPPQGHFRGLLLQQGRKGETWPCRQTSLCAAFGMSFLKSDFTTPAPLFFVLFCLTVCMLRYKASSLRQIMNYGFVFTSDMNSGGKKYILLCWGFIYCL